MISPAFETMMKKTFRDSLMVAVSNRLESESELSARENIDMERIDAENAIALTISSHLFRILIVMYFDFNPTFSRFLTASLGDAVKAGNEKTYDFLYEVGNLYCGTMKRDLQTSVPSLGMSTPNLLKTEAMEHVRSLKLDQENHLELKYQGEGLMFASYFLSAYGDLDVTSVEQENETDAGELEFF
jgi:hypothetical protein